MADKKRLTTTTESPVGRVEHSGGRAIWRWAREKLDSTSILLKKLDNSALKLQAPGARGGDPKHSPMELDLSGELQHGGGGFDPYNNS